MKKKLCIEYLESIRQVVSMENSDFRNCTRSWHDPLLLCDGTPVTEANVTQFIRERTACWRKTWIVGPIDTVIKELKK